MIEFIYDQLNTWGKDDDFFMELLKSTKAKRVADLGCGTGRVTVEMAKLGYEVTGIDPNDKAIELAKQKEHAHDVRWLVGDSSQLETARFDVVIMTANVAQVFTTDSGWMHTLRDIYRALKPGGQLIFDTRNPNAKAWEEWAKDDTIDQHHDVNSGDLLSLWDEYEGLKGSIFTFYEYVKNERTKETFVDKVQLNFRSYEELLESQKEVGFSEVKAYEDWQFKDATPEAKSFIFHSIK
ncbi:class I SAM-dependent methyltransferase [Sutcliffiella halmapala]|uniref:class I SAM-dependent methyltransferase n=1 Tax=Sutcliffiella halmapala TaxID=79882 RepID=UPI0009958E4B|nr:class I SAM-dependent methyltransferase [Sutcliffiella halmapala]